MFESLRNSQTLESLKVWKFESSTFRINLLKGLRTNFQTFRILSFLTFELPDFQNQNTLPSQTEARHTNVLGCDRCAARLKDATPPPMSTPGGTLHAAPHSSVSPSSAQPPPQLGPATHVSSLPARPRHRATRRATLLAAGPASPFRPASQAPSAQRVASTSRERASQPTRSTPSREREAQPPRKRRPR